MSGRQVSAVGEDADNVYLSEFLGLRTVGPRPASGYEAWLRNPGGPTAYERRVAAVRRYAFGIPNRLALDAIGRHAPIVELGAGTGYWAYLLRRRGVEVVAFDVAPPGRAPNAYKFEPRTWTEIKQGGVEVLHQYPNHALFLCWPGYRDTFAEEAIGAYQGNVLLYVGEDRGGNTASDAFFDCLQHDWVAAERVSIPRWSGAHDCLSTFYRRKTL